VRGTAAWDDLVTGGGSSSRVMAYHSSNPSHGTADALGLPLRGVDLAAFDAEAAAADAAAAGAGGKGADGKAAAAPGGKGGRDAAVRAALALGHHLVDFYTNLTLCHSLILEDDPAGGQARYQGPSPDEVALVDAARQLGFEFVARAQTTVTLRVLGQLVTYDILNVMEYSSERGCMSVVARAPDGTVRLFCKGADSKVLAKVRAGTDPALLARQEADLAAFAREGLRTLVIASKVIPEAEYRDWDDRFQTASRLFEGRDEALDALGNEVEAGLELIGATAIEDKLQDGVPAAVATLLAANVRVWMITGDKQETAINIAVSCALVRDVDGVMVVSVDEHGAEAPATQVAALLAAAEARVREAYAKEAGLPAAPARLDDVPDTWRGGELSVDGPALHYILADDALRGRLAALAARCSGVVISRSSPSQKAAIVTAMATYEMDVASAGSRGLARWYRRRRRRLGGKMLAIGDGANDVAMIQTADVGVGIMGKEGRQAVNNSDYAFSQFRFLVPLLLVHGSLSHYRLARLIKYSFYKNIAFAFVMFYFQFFNGFSGQALVDSITAAVFNVAFTSLPILLFAVLDRPVRELHAFVRYPALYDKRRARSLTTAAFWRSGVLLGIIHGAVVFFVPYYAIATSGENNITDVYSIGRVSFVALLGAVTLEVALIARYWTWAFGVVTALSYLAVYPYMLAFPWIELAIGYYDPANMGVSSAVLSSPTYWFVIWLCYAITFGSRYAERTAKWVFAPHDSMILAERERAAEARGGGLMSGMSMRTRRRLAALGTVAAASPSGRSPSALSGGGDAPWGADPTSEDGSVRGGRSPSPAAPARK
jgi:magnesium-transporting ATPase (P-type)